MYLILIAAGAQGLGFLALDHCFQPGEFDLAWIGMYGALVRH
jgi:hypothetical protein